mgnify:FL=1
MKPRCGRCLVAPPTSAWIVLVSGNSLVVIRNWIHIRVVAVQLALVHIVPDVVPHAAPAVPTDDACPNNETVEARRTLQENLIDAGGVESPEEPIQVVLPLTSVCSPSLNPLGLMILGRAKATTTEPRLAAQEGGSQQS